MPAFETFNKAAIAPAYTTVLSDVLMEYGEDNARTGFKNLGAGDDTFTYAGLSWFDPFSRTTQTTSVTQSVNGGAGNDRITVGDANDTVYGGSGNDLIVGKDGDDALYGGSGSDLIGGGDGRDLISGGSGDDWLSGNAGNDRLQGGSGDDLLYGDDVFAGLFETGNDTLSGGSGNDTLYGGQSADILTGGTGADRFAYHVASESTFAARDRITDFSRVEGDRIDLRTLDHAGTADHFSFGPTAAPGSVWLSAVNYDAAGQGTQLVYIDTDGGAADMVVEVALAPGLTGLSGGDFLL